MSIKSRLIALERTLRARLQGAIAHTLVEWLKSGRASPKLSRIIAERMAEADDPLEAEPQPGEPSHEPTTEGGQ